MESRLTELEENIATLKDNSADSVRPAISLPLLSLNPYRNPQVALLQTQTDEITKERDTLRETLRYTINELFFFVVVIR